jgi:RNA polymerase sigma factor (sigma-70 family)
MRPQLEDAYDELYRREHAAIVHAAHLIVGDVEVAHEVAQEAFGALYQHWDKVHAYDRPGAWVRRVAIRMAVKTARRRERSRHAEVHASASAAGPDRGPADTDAEVLAAVRGLPANQRAAVVLFYFEDASVADIADVLGCRTSTAKVHLHRARQRLAVVLATEVPDVVG